jgi:hypothetical protein
MLVNHSRAVAAGGVALNIDPMRAFEPGWLSRVGARIRSRSLDSELVAGADPAASPQLAARAARLTARSTRLRLAGALERLALSDSERSRTSPHVLPFTTAIRANAGELNELGGVLRGTAPVYARGVAMLRLLITDGTGPVYSDRDGRVLADQLRRARTAIGGLA